MIKVSVIIPVYNAEQYIAECIESLLNQTLIDCEFIFVNDGSVDQSKNIIESFQEKDKRIILINQKNQGVSVARNQGLRIAQGEYIGFVDADDYIKDDYYYILYGTAVDKNVDIVISNFIIEYQEKTINSSAVFPVNKPFLSDEIKSVIVPVFIEQDILNSVWNKIYSSKLIKENNVFFPDGMKLGEDGLFNIQAFFKSEAVLFIEYLGYFYREVSNSATRNSSSMNHFAEALEKFNIDYKKDFGIDFDRDLIEDFKSKRLINTVISLIHIYLAPNKETSFKFKYNCVKKIITNDLLQNTIKKNWVELLKNRSKYIKIILISIRLELILALIVVSAYSNFRNNIK